jgi:hypothetical protein
MGEYVVKHQHLNGYIFHILFIYMMFTLCSFTVIVHALHTVLNNFEPAIDYLFIFSNIYIY